MIPTDKIEAAAKAMKNWEWCASLRGMALTNKERSAAALTAAGYGELVAENERLRSAADRMLSFLDLDVDANVPDHLTELLRSALLDRITELEAEVAHHHRQMEGDDKAVVVDHWRQKCGRLEARIAKLEKVAETAQVFRERWSACEPWTEQLRAVAEALEALLRCNHQFVPILNGTVLWCRECNALKDVDIDWTAVDRLAEGSE